MLFFQNLHGFVQITVNFGTLFPGNIQQPVQIIADYGSFRRHAAHVFQLFNFGQSFFFSLGTELSLIDFFIIFDDFGIIFPVAEFFLDRLNLFIQIIFFLAFFHLLFYTVFNFAFDFQQSNFGIHKTENFFKAVFKRRPFQQCLLVGNL